MEDAGTSEEDDIDSQDSNTPIDHGHLARNFLIKINIILFFAKLTEEEQNDVYINQIMTAHVVNNSMVENCKVFHNQIEEICGHLDLPI